MNYIKLWSLIFCVSRVSKAASANRHARSHMWLLWPRTMALSLSAALSRGPPVFCNNLWKKLQTKCHSPGLWNNGRAHHQLNLTLNFSYGSIANPTVHGVVFFSRCKITHWLRHTIEHERTNYLDIYGFAWFVVVPKWMHFVAWAWARARAWVCGCCLDVAVLSLHFDFCLICC